jgi:hypothetical protein
MSQGFTSQSDNLPMAPGSSGVSDSGNGNPYLFTFQVASFLVTETIEGKLILKF